MKSLQVARHTAPESGSYSELQVMRSPAGWYIGTLWNSPDSFPGPGSRDSCYFHTEADAAFALDLCQRLYAEVERQRKAPHPLPDLTDEEFSADFAAILVMCGLDPNGVGYRLEP